MSSQHIWIIQTSKSRNIVGCFLQKDDAESYIHTHQLQCMLIQYPINQAVFDWTIEKGYWIPKHESQKTSNFIGDFSSAYLQHEHYYQGED